MSQASSSTVHAGEPDFQLTLVELSRASGASEEQLRVWVLEGVIHPLERPAPDWRFPPVALRRARVAARLSNQLDVNAPGVALALDLMDELAALRATLRRAGLR